MTKITACLLIGVLFAVVCCGPGDARPPEYPLAAEGEYFAVYAYPGADLHDLLNRIHVDSLLLSGGEFAAGGDSVGHMTARAFDALYLEVCEILGVGVYTVKGSITVFPDQPALGRAFRARFRQDFHERAFYVHEEKALYISHEDLHLGMLAHEMAHMAISNYFIVPPSYQVQEILCGYVEYSFRKRLPVMNQ